MKKREKRLSDYLMLGIPALVLGTIVGAVAVALFHGFWPAIIFLLPGSLWLLLLVDQYENWDE